MPYNARGRPISCELVYSGLSEKMRGLDELKVRAMTWYEVSDEIFNIWEQSERNVFGQFSPKGVKTGALKASLTERDADGAIREASEAGIHFGTTIPYARAAASRINGGVHMVRITRSSYVKIRFIIAAWVRGKGL